MTMFTPNASAKWRSRDENRIFFFSLNLNFDITGFGVTFILAASCGPSGTAAAETATDTTVTVTRQHINTVAQCNPT